MLFNFTLDPIDEIEPWGVPPDLSLSWFGLTLGQYFLQAGSDQLLRYSDAAQRILNTEAPVSRVTPFVDYQVARLHQDIFEIVPRIVEPIPRDLIPFATSTSSLPWRAACKEWFERRAGSDDASWDLQYAAVAWLGQRSLDTGYLSPCAMIWFWRFEDTIHIEWDNRAQIFEGVPLWSALRGSHSLSVEEFMTELRSFHARFIEAMGLRVEEACRSWSRPKIRIDPDQLRAEQSYWDCPIERLILRWEPTDWETVNSAVRHIESSADR
jgi:hypothetical protein